MTAPGRSSLCRGALGVVASRSVKKEQQQQQQQPQQQQQQQKGLLWGAVLPSDLNLSLRDQILNNCCCICFQRGPSLAAAAAAADAAADASDAAAAAAADDRGEKYADLIRCFSCGAAAHAACLGLSDQTAAAAAAAAAEATAAAAAEETLRDLCLLLMLSSMPS